MDQTQQDKQDQEYATFSDQQPLTIRVTVAGMEAIAISLDMTGDDEAEELLGKVNGAIPPGAALGDFLFPEFTIAEWRYIAHILHSDLGRWQPTMADDIDAALAANGWVD